MKILVTGGAGFVGSHLCESLLLDGHKIDCIDNFYNSKYPNIHNSLQYKGFRFINKDVNDNLEENIDFTKLDCIVHLAANIHVDKSVIDPVNTYKTNLLSTLNLLELTRKYDIKRFVLASSSEVYGSAQYKPIDELHPLASPHPYGASKIAADRLCKSYIDTYGLSIGISRCFNIYGPRQKSGILGSLIPMTIDKVLNNKSPIVYGDGTQSRDYLYIDDAVNSYKTLLSSNKVGEYNFGTGIEHKIIDIINFIIEFCNSGVTPTYIKGRSSEVISLIANYSKSNTELGWSPTVDFKDGLRRTVEWYKINL